MISLKLCNPVPVTKARTKAVRKMHDAKSLSTRQPKFLVDDNFLEALYCLSQAICSVILLGTPGKCLEWNTKYLEHC